MLTREVKRCALALTSMPTFFYYGSVSSVQLQNMAM